MCGHIYKCGFTYISVSVIFTAIYRFLTQTAPYIYEHREARGGLGHAGAGHAHATYTNVWCTRIACDIV